MGGINVKKYSFTGETLNWNGVILHRIKANIGIFFYNIRAGDLGGWIESEENLSQYGDAWVGGEAKVYNSAHICGSVFVGEKAQVFGEANISGIVYIMGSAQISGKSEIWGGNHSRRNPVEIYGSAQIRDSSISESASISGTSIILDSVVSNHARISGNARISDHAEVFGISEVCDNSQVTGGAKVYDHAKVCGCAHVSNHAEVFGNSEVRDNSQVTDKAKVFDSASISGNSKISGEGTEISFGNVDNKIISHYSPCYDARAKEREEERQRRMKYEARESARRYEGEYHPLITYRNRKTGEIRQRYAWEPIETEEERREREYLEHDGPPMKYR